ncbi:MAG: alpha/beta fold hydrolase [Rhodomicrobium sp.]
MTEISRRQAMAGVAALGAAFALCPPHKSNAGPAAAGEKKWLTLPPTPALPATERSGLVEIDRTKIFFAQFGNGEGPPVLLLHGGLGSSNYWGHQIEYLAGKYRVIVMDTRGHGRSPVMSKVFGYAQFADDVAALLDYLKIDAASVIGWSDGAVTGLQLAIARPKRVSRLFAFGANVTLDGLKGGGARTRVFAEYAARCRIEYRALSPNPEKWPELVAGLSAMWRREPNFGRQTLASIKVPVTVSDGEHDEIIRPDHTARIAKTIPKAKKVILPGVSHFAMLQNPAQFNRAVQAFLGA